MHIEVDQSGKIEDTASNTVLAFANGASFVILIPAREKRLCLQALRARGKTGKSIYRLLFATALFFLLKDAIARRSVVTIDIEYQGHDAGIKEHLLNLLRRANTAVDAHQIRFAYIGKKSPAHTKAYDVQRGRAEPNRVVSAEELLGEFV
jgi:hypothetical protein